jgi:hypothetical protein
VQRFHNYRPSRIKRGLLLLRGAGNSGVTESPRRGLISIASVRKGAPDWLLELAAEINLV